MGEDFKRYETTNEILSVTRHSVIRLPSTINLVSCTQALPWQNQATV